MKFDIISIGDATLDTFIEIEEATVTCTLDKKNCQLCLNYADKIPIDSLVRKIAGNAANNAVGSARLGMKAAYWTIMGDDNTAKLLLRTLRKEGISNKFVQIQKGSESNYTVVLNYKGERTQLIYKVKRNYTLPKLDPSKWVYLTAMGETHEVSYNDLLKHIVKHRVQLAYNPGKIQIECNYKKCIDLFSYTHILFTNKEEAQMILKTKNGNIRYLLKHLKAMGPDIVVVTDGINGSYCEDAEGDLYFSPIAKGKLIERTGAGDAYATGFIAAMHNGKSTQEAMKWGTVNAMNVVEHIGPQDGLLATSKMKQLVKSKARFRVKKL